MRSAGIASRQRANADQANNVQAVFAAAPPTLNPGSPRIFRARATLTGANAIIAMAEISADVRMASRSSRNKPLSVAGSNASNVADRLADNIEPRRMASTRA